LEELEKFTVLFRACYHRLAAGVEGEEKENLDSAEDTSADNATSAICSSSYFLRHAAPRG